MRQHLCEWVSKELQAMVQDPAVRSKIEEQGARSIGNTPEQFKAFINREIAHWGEVIRKADILLG
jgi:tripartite-type tricarboxylate transporter receptor subunit TctC